MPPYSILKTAKTNRRTGCSANIDLGEIEHGLVNSWERSEKSIIHRVELFVVVELPRTSQTLRARGGWRVGKIQEAIRSVAMATEGWLLRYARE